VHGDVLRRRDPLRVDGRWLTSSTASASSLRDAIDSAHARDACHSAAHAAFGLQYDAVRGVATTAREAVLVVEAHEFQAIAAVPMKG